MHTLQSEMEVRIVVAVDFRLGDDIEQAVTTASPLAGVAGSVVPSTPYHVVTRYNNTTVMAQVCCRVAHLRVPL